MKKTSKFSILFLMAALLASAVGLRPSGVARAASLTVNTLMDGMPAVDGNCTLREAIENANDDNATNADCGAGSGADIIFLPSGIITLSDDLPPITSNIEIRGVNSNNNHDSPIDGDDVHQIFYVTNTGNLTLRYLTLMDGTCDGGMACPSGTGGAIYAEGPVTLDNVYLWSNYAHYGGAIYTTSTLQMQGGSTSNPYQSTLFFDNNAFFSGGAVYVFGASAAAQGNSVMFNNNSSDGDSGAIRLDGGSLTLDEAAFYGNFASSDGGAIHLGTCAAAQITDSTFNSNSSDTSYGGAIFAPSGCPSAVIERSIFTGNTADGGGAIANSFATPMIRNSVFNYNRASDGGAIMNITFANPKIVNSTFAHNQATMGNGGAIYTNSVSGALIVNSIVYNNTATGSGAGIWTDGTSVSVSYSNVQFCNPMSWGAECGTNDGNNVMTDPLFQDEDGADNIPGDTDDNFRLKITSPMIDAGNNTTTHLTGVTTDKDGLPRFTNVTTIADTGTGTAPIVDMGAHEAAVYTSVSSQDGWVLESTETSNTGGTRNAGGSTLLVGDNAQNKQYRAILSFNTASLPDNAVITKVILRVKRQGVTGGGNPITAFRGFKVDIKQGNFGTSALQLGDFKTAGSQTLGSFKPSLVGGWYALNLTGGKSKINQLGNTQIRLRFQTDDNNNFIANFLSLYSGNAASSSRPQLILEFYIPAP